MTKRSATKLPAQRLLLLLGLGLALTLGEAVAAKGGRKPGGGGGTPAPAIAYMDGEDLMVMDADGSNPTLLVGSAGLGTFAACRPDWSPDGAWVVFNPRSDVLGGPGLDVVHPDGTGLHQVIALPSPAYEPRWSPLPGPDGVDRILFSGADGDLYLVRPDGSGLVDLTGTPLEQDWSPTWAPDGRRVAAFRELVGAGGGRFSLVVHTLAADGADLVVDSTAVLVTNTEATWGVIAHNLVWARGSDRLAFDGRAPDGSEELYVVDLQTPALAVAVTQTPALDEKQADWSPDDTRLVYRRSARRPRDAGLYTIRVDGSDAAAILPGQAPPLAYPAWRR